MDLAPALVLCAIHKTWRAGIDGCSAHASVLRGAELEVAAGELVALCGPAGAGKTTLLLCAAGLVRPDAGTITIGGEPAIPAALRSAIYLDSAATAAASPLVAPAATRARIAERGPMPRTRLLLVDSLDRAEDPVHAVRRLRALATRGVAVVIATRERGDALEALRAADARVVRLAHGRIVAARERAGDRAILATRSGAARREP